MRSSPTWLLLPTRSSRNAAHGTQYSLPRLSVGRARTPFPPRESQVPQRRNMVMKLRRVHNLIYNQLQYNSAFPPHVPPTIQVICTWLKYEKHFVTYMVEKQKGRTDRRTDGVCPSLCCVQPARQLHLRELPAVLCRSKPGMQIASSSLT